MQERPTGSNFKMQIWPYCPRCWQQSQSNGHDPQMIAAMYDRFLKFILGNYGLERRFHGNQASRIEPKNGTGELHGKNNVKLG